MNIRRISKTEYEVWTKYESDRIRVRKMQGQWRLVGSYVGNIYAPSTTNPAIKDSAVRAIEASI